MYIIYSTCDRLYKSRQRAAFTNHGSGFYKSRQRLLQITAAAFTNHGGGFYKSRPLSSQTCPSRAPKLALLSRVLGVLGRIC